MNKNYFILIEKFRGIFDTILDFYVKRFSNIIDVDFEFWVGDMRKEDKQANRPTQPVDVANFGDYYFNLDDIRTVVDNYRYWLQRYGTREAVGEEVCDWHDYVLERMGRNKIYLNLFNWLNGAPRDIDDNDMDAAHGRPTDKKEEGANG